MANSTDSTPKKEKFIAELRKCGNVSKAARLARIDRQTAYNWKAADKKFEELWKLAIDESGDLLEEEAWRRAATGVKKPIYQGGKRVGYVQDYSDTLLIFLLKGTKPDKYRERVETNQNNFDFNNADLSLLNDYEIERLIAGDDPRSVFAAASKRITREKAQAG